MYPDAPGGLDSPDPNAARMAVGAGGGGIELLGGGSTVVSVVKARFDDDDSGTLVDGWVAVPRPGPGVTPTASPSSCSPPRCCTDEADEGNIIEDDAPASRRVLAAGVRM